MYKVLAFLTLLFVGIAFFIDGQTCACDKMQIDPSKTEVADDTPKVEKKPHLNKEGKEITSLYDALFD